MELLMIKEIYSQRSKKSLEYRKSFINFTSTELNLKANKES